MSKSLVVVMTGIKQGVFHGSQIDLDGVAASVVHRMSMMLSTPINAATGQTTGRTQHIPASFTKNWDSASVQLLDALSSHELLTAVKFELIETDAARAKSLSQTMTFKNVIITNQSRYLTEAVPGDAMSARFFEDVTFTYEEVSVMDEMTKRSINLNW